MKPATIRYTTLLGILLLGTAVAWNSLLEARGTSVPVPRLMQAAQLFEQQGRLGKAADMYRRVLADNPRHVQARLRLAMMKKKAESVLGVTTPTARKPVSSVTLAQAEKPVTKANSLPEDVTSIPLISSISQKRPAKPKNTFQKTRKALAQAGDRFKGLIPDFAVSKPNENPTDGGEAVVQEAANVSDSSVKAAEEEKARLVAKAVQEEKTRLAAKAAQEEKTQLAAKAAEEEKTRLAAKAAEEEKTRLTAKAAEEEKTRLAEQEIKEAKQSNSDGQPEVKTRPAEATGFKNSRTRKILSQVGEKIQTIRPESTPERPDFEEMGVIPPKPQIPLHLKRNGLAKTSPALRRPIQELDKDGQPVPVLDVIAPTGTTAEITPVADGTVLPKTQRTLAKVKDRVGGLIPRVPKRLNTSRVLDSARETVDGLLPRSTGRLESSAVEVAVPESTDQKKVGAGTEFLSKSRDAWAKFRKGVSSGGNRKPKVNRSPLWKRLSEALRGQKTEVVVLEKSPVATEDAVKTALPTPAVRNNEIPPLTVEEQIEDAKMKLAIDANDPSGRKALIQVVTSAPDFEAALAAYTLGTRAKGHADIMTALGEQLMLRRGVAKVHMAEAMLRFDGNHATATESLVKLTASEDKRVRMMAAFSMQAATKSQKERCITALIKVLKDEDSDVRASAALALGAFGPSAKRAIPAIATVIHDVDPGTARAAGVALQCVARQNREKTTIRPVAAGVIESK